MSTPEGRIQQGIQKRVRERGGYVIKIHGSPLMPQGTPDLLICYKGFFIGMEVKTPDTQTNVSPAQQLRLKQIKDAGGSAVVVWSVQMADRLLDTMDAMIDALDSALDDIPQEAAERGLKRWRKRVRR